MMGLIAVENQYDRMMGRATTVHQFQMMELKSFNIADVKDFLSRVEFMLTEVPFASIDYGDGGDHQFMWLFLKFMNRKPIQMELAPIKKAPLGSPLTFGGLLMSTCILMII